MSTGFRFRLFSYSVYAILLLGIFFESFSIARHCGIISRNTESITCKVNVDGNVRKPGWYLVPQGTTEYEILQVAGIRLSSDIMPVSLSSQIVNNQTINIGTLTEPLVLSDKKENAAVEQFFGEGRIIHSDGKEITLNKGSNIVSGDRITLNASTQAEISTNKFSKIDLDNFSDLTFNKINESSNNQTLSEITQNAGLCWHRIVYSSSGELYRIYTASVIITVVGSGADFSLDVQNNQIVISVFSGILLAERRAGGESTNLISGQTATIFNDSRPFLVSKLLPDNNINEQFSQLSNGKSDILSTDAPLNVLICIAPANFFIVRMDFTKGELHLIRIPESLLIEKFSTNLSTIDQAYLYGGPIFITSFLERLFDSRIHKYISCNKAGIEAITSILGGITVNVDSKAAEFLKVSKGTQKLTGDNISRFGSPQISGFNDSRERQSQILKAIFNAFMGKNITLTLPATDNIVNFSEVNFSSPELLEYFSKFSKRNNWVYKEYIIPSQSVSRNARVCFDPLTDDCRRIMNND